MDATLMREFSGLLAALPHVASGLPQTAAGAFVASLWQGLVLAAGAWLCLRIVPRVTAAVRFTVWTAVFAVLAALPFLHVFLPVHAGGTEQTLAAHGAMLHVDVRWSFAIAGLWAACSLARAGILLASGLRLHGIWKRSTPVNAGSLPLAGMGTRRARLCTSHDVDRPSVIGFFSPRILIPQDLFERLTASELEHIVLHEMGHLRRRDDWMNLAQKLGLVVFPLNPALAWIERRLCLERELACDDDVLRLTRAPKAYARCLTSLAEQRLERRAATLSLGAWERRSELGRRVHSILRGSEGMGRTQARVAMSALVLALLGGAAELARCPRVVSFASAAPVSQAAISAPVYRPILATASNTPHETLLKATVPNAAVVPVVRRHARRHAPTLLRAKRNEIAPAHVQQWIVMTSWTSSGAMGTTKVSRMVFTVPGERGDVPTYAAVPTGDGWLVLQL